MSIVGGLDLHRGQITLTRSRPIHASCGEAAFGTPIDSGRLAGCASSLHHVRVSEQLRSRSKVAPVGATSPWRSPPPAMKPTSPTRPTLQLPRPQASCQDRSHRRCVLRELLVAGDLPESWIPPQCVLEWRERVRLYKTLFDQRTQWIQRIHAELFQHGVPVPEGEITFASNRCALVEPNLSLTPAARERIGSGYSMIDATNAQALPFEPNSPDSAPVRPPAGLRRRTFRHRRSHCGGHLVRPRRLPAFPPLTTGRSPRRNRHHRRSPPISIAPVAGLTAKVLRLCAGPSMRPPSARRGPRRPTSPITPRSKPNMTESSPPSPCPANSFAAATTPFVPSIPRRSTPFPQPRPPFLSRRRSGTAHQDTTITFFFFFWPCPPRRSPGRPSTAEPTALLFSGVIQSRLSSRTRPASSSTQLTGERPQTGAHRGSYQSTLGKAQMRDGS